jgi:hypothetical protein
MNDSLSPSQNTFRAQSYYAGVIQSRLIRREATRERAQRLYAIGELHASAQMLAELASRRQPNQVDFGEETVTADCARGS